MTYRQGYEKTLSEVARGRDVPEFAIKDAQEKLTPPSIDELTDAAERAMIGPDGVDWASTQFMMFLELSRQRARNKVPQPLAFPDILAYQQLNRLEFHPVEINNFLALDQVFIEWAGDLMSQQMQELKAKAGKHG